MAVLAEFLLPSASAAHIERAPSGLRSEIELAHYARYLDHSPHLPAVQMKVEPGRLTITALRSVYFDVATMLGRQWLRTTFTRDSDPALVQELVQSSWFRRLSDDEVFDTPPPPSEPDFQWHVLFFRSALAERIETNFRDVVLSAFSKDVSPVLGDQADNISELVLDREHRCIEFCADNPGLRDPPFDALLRNRLQHFHDTFQPIWSYRGRLWERLREGEPGAQ